MPIARVQTPDGRVARFEVPEGTTPEQAMEMIAQQFPNLSPGRSTAQEVGRQVGLTARYGVEGLTTPVNMIGDALGLRSSESVSNLLSKIGLPQPEGATERVVGDVARAMAGQGGVSAAGRGMAGAAGPVVQRIGDLLRSNVGSQITGAAGAAGAAGATREAGGGPVAQTVAGLVGGVVAPIAGDVALTATKAAARGVKAAVDPFTQAGRERVVGSTLKRMATDPDAAAQRMADAPEQIPGSRPTTAQAARDEGLLIAERGVSSSNPQAGARLARRASEQNQARNLLLSSMAGDEAALKAAKGAREGQAGALYRQAREEGIDVEMAKALKPQITNLMQRMPKGVLEKAKELARMNGETFDKTGSVNGLHWMKLAVDDAISSAKQTGVGDQTTRSLMQFKDDLLSVVDEVSPTYGQARAQYAEMSKPINQMETLQDIQGRVLNAGTDAATGERVMSAAKFYNAVTKNEGDLRKVLTSDQMRNLKAIGRDLDSAALSASSGKAAGSNTTQNLSTAYVIGSALGNKTAESGIVQNLARPISWLNKLNEQQVQDLLVDAMLEPALARSLMMKATPRNLESIGFELQQRAIAKGLGGLFGTSATAGRRQEAELATP